MNIKIRDNQLMKAFSGMMKEFSELEHSEKSYDYWIEEKQKYSDIYVENFYEDIEFDYEDDQWILQYQKTPGDIGKPKELPILRYGDWRFKNIISILGKDNFERLLGEWFTDIYGLPVKTVKVEE
jgi:hypothetical protein